MNGFIIAAAAAGLLAAVPATAGTVSIEGTRSNISPGGSPMGRCAPAITVSFAPDLFTASGTSTLGNFTYVASHCIVPPLPAAYFDGVFEWTLADGTLFGTHSGALLSTGQMGVYDVVETLIFTGGTGFFVGTTGTADFVGQVRFGQFQGGPASFGEGRFTGKLNIPAIPEPASWAMMIAGFGIVGMAARRRRSRHNCGLILG